MRFLVKGSLFGLLVGSAGVAAASFDLVMALDKTSQRVHRYDGSTGVYLGAFAQGWVSSESQMVLNQPAGEVAVTSGAYIRVFDYSTGLLKRTYTSPLAGILASNGDEPGFMWLASTDGLARVNLNTGSVNFISQPVPGTGIRHIAGGSADLRVSDAATNRVYRTTNGGTSWTFVSAPTQLGLNPGQGIRSDNFFGDYYFVTPGVAGLYYHFGVGVASVNLIGTYTSVTGVARAHGGSAYIIGTASGTTRVTMLDSYLNLGYNFAAPQVTGPSQLAVVVAPEPSVMIGLAAGALALVRRRKSRRA